MKQLDLSISFVWMTEFDCCITFDCSFLKNVCNNLNVTVMTMRWWSEVKAQEKKNGFVVILLLLFGSWILECSFMNCRSEHITRMFYQVREFWNVRRCLGNFLWILLMLFYIWEIVTHFATWATVSNASHIM